MIGNLYLITGGTSGLGESIVHELINRGAYVIICGRNNEKLESVKRVNPEKIRTVLLNMNNIKDIEHLTDQLKKNDVKLDGIINNAGYGYFKSLEKHSDEEIVDMVQVNFTHTVLLTKKLLPYIKIHGHIINVTSQAARVTTPYGSIYAATKSALYSFSNALRMEYPHMHVMTVNPGPISTSFFDHADESGHYSEMTKRIQLNKDILAAEIVDGIIQRKVEVNRPLWMHYSLSIYQLMPRWIERNFEKAFLSKIN